MQTMMANPPSNRRVVLAEPQKKLQNKHSVGELKTINIDISSDYATKPQIANMQVRGTSKLSQPSQP